MYKVNMVYDVDILINMFCEKYKIITGNSTVGKSKTVVKEPIIQSHNRKIYIQNFYSVCNSINRNPQDISTYISKEFNIQTSISGNEALIIHGNYRKNDIENILRKYIKIYVQCPLCFTQDTKIEKIDRIQFIVCNKCHAKNAIS